MTICRYFLQGNCRFGERCRFEHTDPSNHSNSYNRRGNEYPSNRETSYYQNDYQHRNNRETSYYRNENEYRNVREPPSYNQYYSGNQRYVQNDFYEYSHRGDVYGYHPQDQRYSVPQAHDRYTSQSWNELKKYESNAYNYSNNKSKTQWVSQEYRHQQQQKSQHKSFHSPKSEVSFSFKTPEKVSRADSAKDTHISVKSAPYVNMVKEDALEWELSSLWIFTCYSPIFSKSGSNFPGFSDISPEELRFEAYKAEKDGTLESYVSSIEKAVEDIKRNRNNLKISSPKLLSIIEKIAEGEDLNFEDTIDGGASLSSLSETKLESMIADESLPVISSASFSFKSHLGSADVKQKFGSTTSDIYTPIEKLSAGDKEQFAASTFKLGKIPTVPPPQAMCV